MPTFAKTISALPEHVFFPIIRQVSKRVLKSLSLSEIIGDRIYINTEWSTHSNTSDKTHNARLGEESFRVEANVQLNPSSQKWDTYTFKHTGTYGINTFNIDKHFAPVYSDSRNEVYIYEMFSPVTITLNCELFLQSADLAFQSPQQIFNNHNNGEVTTLTDLTYTYPIPKHILYILQELWELDRVNGKPAKVGFLDYLKLRVGDAWRVDMNRETGQKQIVKQNYNLQCMTVLEYSEDKPTGVMENKLPVAWTIPFTYTIQFAMPTFNVIQYPVVYDNQLIDLNKVPKDTNNRNNRIHELYVDRGFNIGTDGAKPEWHRTVVIPPEDDWAVRMRNTTSNVPYMPVLIQSLVLDDEKAKSATENLANLGDDVFKLKPIIKEMIYRQGNDSFKNNVLFAVRVFRDNKELLSPDCSIDEDLNLTWRVREYYHRYRIVIFLLMNVDYIDFKYVEDLKELFPWLPVPIKQQIMDKIKHPQGPWHDAWLPDDIEIGDDGWIYGPDDFFTNHNQSNHGQGGGVDVGNNTDSTGKPRYPADGSYENLCPGKPIIPIVGLGKPYKTNGVPNGFNQNQRIFTCDIIAKHF